MHYNWQILVKGSNEAEAQENAESVLYSIDHDNYANVWDYFSIGGRWPKTRNSVCATTRAFWARLKSAEEAQVHALNRSIEGLKEELEKEGTDLEEWLFRDNLSHTKSINMIGYYVTKIAKFHKGDYQSESYLATEGEIWGSAQVPDDVKAQIKANPHNYWLVNVDIHN